MAERPILFSAPMVRAILEGRKTVTRRVVNRIASLGPVTELDRSDTAGYDWHCRDRRSLWNDLREGELLARCPYGQVGDRLWVRETAFRMPHPADAGLTPADLPRTWQAACDAAGQILYRANVEPHTASLVMSDGERWKPSIHMPKAWARIWLEVTSVRVERLKDISEWEAMNEGAPLGVPDGDAALLNVTAMHRVGFALLWDRLAKTGTRWADNPWVWVVEFKRIEKEARAA